MSGLAVDIVDAVTPALAVVADALSVRLDAVCHATADSAAREMRARLGRQLGPNASGQTVAGIEVVRAYDGNGWVVLSDNARMPNLPLWIEKGTHAGKPGSHASAARPYFYQSIQLVSGPHEQRIHDAMTDGLAEQGLG